MASSHSDNQHPPIPRHARHQALFDELSEVLLGNLLRHDTQQATLKLLRRRLGVKMGSFCALDPTTGLPTSLVTSGAPSPPAPLFHHITSVYFRRDLSPSSVLSVPRMRRDGVQVRRLSDPRVETERWTEYVPKLAQRYGVMDELRVLAVHEGVVWGALGLIRSPGRFRTVDEPIMQTIAHTMGQAMHRAHRERMRRQPAAGALPSGFLLVGKGGRLTDASPGLEAWLRERAHLRHDRALSLFPTLCFSPGSHAQRLSLTTEDGYLSLRTQVLRDEVLVTVSPAAVEDHMALCSVVFGLTPRERGILRWLRTGASTRRVAFELDIADDTVQSHVRAVCRKLGVSRRSEAVAVATGGGSLADPGAEAREAGPPPDTDPPPGAHPQTDAHQHHS